MSQPFFFDTAAGDGPTNPAVADVGSNKIADKASGYQKPQLRQVGTLGAMQGRNYYSDRDLGNTCYYV